METVPAILKAIEDVVGVDAEEMKGMLDENLAESGLIDSLSVISIIQSIEASIGHGIDIKSMAPSDFATVNTLAAAIEKQLQ